MSFIGFLSRAIMRSVNTMAFCKEALVVMGGFTKDDGLSGT